MFNNLVRNPPGHISIVLVAKRMPDTVSQWLESKSHNDRLYRM
jgi:hypothetical protein